jgi:hypothetical protein
MNGLAHPPTTLASRRVGRCHWGRGKAAAALQLKTLVFGCWILVVVAACQRAYVDHLEHWTKS